jgi:hypothetical protein
VGEKYYVQLERFGFVSLSGAFSATARSVRELLSDIDYGSVYIRITAGFNHVVRAVVTYL